MKKIFFLFIFLTLPFSLHADESTTTPNLVVNLNVRYKSTLVFSAPITIVKNSTENITDNLGVSHLIPSDSALAALSTADANSGDFSLSNLNYYSDYDSFFINCIDVTSPSNHACNNWQYVVNSAYPPMGADKYILSDNDTVYFYFGNARRVVLSTPTAETNAPVTIKTESYNYTDDTWSPLGNMLIGATQPDPNNPYSPTVLSSVRSDGNGVATLSIGTPGVYNVGLDADYYNPTEALTITTPPVPVETNLEPVQIRSGGSSSQNRAAVVEILENNKTLAEKDDKVLIDDKKIDDSPLIDITISNDDVKSFVKRYNEIIKNLDKDITTKPLINKVPVVTKNSSQTASVGEVAITVKPKTNSWFNNILKIFGL